MKQQRSPDLLEIWLTNEGPKLTGFWQEFIFTALSLLFTYIDFLTAIAPICHP